MIIDDARYRREKQYQKVFSDCEFEPIFIWSQKDLEKHKDTPVDGYIIDVFLNSGEWSSPETNAAELLKNYIQNAPRPAPVFFVSQLWGDDKVLDILKQANETTVKVVQYLAWSEFHQATEDNHLAESRMNALRNKILFELNRWHGRSGFRPEPDDSIRILIISDIQFGDPNTDTKATFAEQWIARTLKKENALPDLIVVAGDISYNGRPDQFELAEEMLELDLMALLWGKNNIERMRERIILVPGNHDVNLRFSACDKLRYDLDGKKFIEDNDPPIKSKIGHQEYALEPFRRFARRITKDRNWDDYPDLSWVDRRFLHCGIRFFVLNSVTSLNSMMPKKASLSENSVREIGRSLVGDDNETIFSIAVSHHGLRPESSPDTETQIDNWERVGRDFFSMHGIRLWIYGHYHDFYPRSLNGEPFNTKPLWMVQAPTARISSSKRGFCLIELERKDGNIVDAYAHNYVFEKSNVKKYSSVRIYDKG
jgi:predicted phosphodiesterase